MEDELNKVRVWDHQGGTKKNNHYEACSSPRPAENEKHKYRGLERNSAQHQ